MLPVGMAQVPPAEMKLILDDTTARSTICPTHIQKLFGQKSGVVLVGDTTPGGRQTRRLPR